MGTSDDAVPAGHDPNRGETVRGKEGRHHVPDYDGEGGGGVDAALDANEAVIASENELREARQVSTRTSSIYYVLLGEKVTTLPSR